MSDTYNPNEIVKCKHLNEFARQLRIKLDGGTDPKTARAVTFVKISSPSTYATLVDGIYKVSTRASWFNGNPLSIGLVLTVDTGAPLDALCYVSDFNAPTNYYLSNLRILYTANQFALYLSTSTTPTAGDIIAVTFVIPEDTTYAELRVPIEITIVADS